MPCLAHDREMLRSGTDGTPLMHPQAMSPSRLSDPISGSLFLIDTFVELTFCFVPSSSQYFSHPNLWPLRFNTQFNFFQCFHLMVNHARTIRDVSIDNTIPRLLVVQRNDCPYCGFLHKFLSLLQPFHGRHSPQHERINHILHIRNVATLPTNGSRRQNPSSSKYCLLVSSAHPAVSGRCPLSRRKMGNGAPVGITDTSTLRLYLTDTLCHVCRMSCKNSKSKPFTPALIWCGLTTKFL